ncbi:cytosolic phospholipase A2-like isoform X3 [Homarus americanus]|uniref:cytosolic phospholipase A2-like isoform X3 n=1 Tax=Homarus americanus TaxID=6706 RepID=UPI001C451D2B|nr:cytosolic phospholipase A2-like isoform X3 [Homarus americanus]
MPHVLITGGGRRDQLPRLTVMENSSESRLFYTWRRNARKQSGYDPFQVFEVEHEACLDLEIVIKRGESITKGSTLKDFVDTPDPYVIMKIPGSSNPSKRTSHVDNCVSPIWDETFHFFLDPSKEHELNVILMDANYTVDETLGDDKFCINQLTNDVPTDHTFYFHGGSKVHTTLKLQKNKTPDLRFSLALCQKEKDFLQIRRKKVLAAMQRVLGTEAPDTERQVPIISILGSGGGFRAMTCLSGAIKALHESGILDCATYISGLSGSSWYISTLYAHDNFPEVTHDQIQKELRESVTKDWKRMLINALSYVSSMIIKYKQGQPVSFTDFFGHLLGDVLLKGQKHKKLTDTQRILARGAVPLPLYTCLHAKKKVSCRSFSEWVEFSPYEIGIAKYGTFMKTEDFGNKFIVGKKIKHFEELPLHFLQGVWGSAFTILIKRLVMEGGKKDMVQIMRDAQQENNLEDNLKDTISSGESSDTEDEEDIQGKDDKESEEEDLGITVESHCTDSDKFYECPSLAFGDNNSHCRSDGESSISPQQKNDQNKAMLTTKSLDLDSLKLSERNQKQNRRKISEPFSFDMTKMKSSRDNRKESTISDPGVSTNYQTAQESRLNRQGAFKATRLRKQVNVSDEAGKNVWANRRKTLRKSRVDKKAGFWDALKQNIMTGTNILNSRAGRAGEVLNPFRGLSLRHSFPISPFAADAMAEEEDQEDQVDSDMDFGASCRYKALDNTAKKLFIVDSGLAFNSPYPLLLRPQRAVDIYLSFDFSQRPKDSSPPFKELLLAEKWAIQNKVPFPPIQKQIEQYENEEVRECYVFKHPDDQFCPVILHFPLVNNKFRDFKAPGVPRETEEEKQFADFPIFDDPQNPFSSMNFVYEPLQYDRLTKLVEFNTLSCIDTIKKEIEEAVVRQKNCVKVSFDSVVNTFTRVSSFRKKVDGSSLRLKVSEEKKRQFKNIALREAGIERQVSTDSSEGEFSDALEELPDESSHL